MIPIVGNLTADPELRFTAAGAAACRFTVAHNPSHYDRDAGEWKDGEPTFFDCTAWRELAEHLADSLGSGDRVILVGNLRTRRWESDGSGKTAAGTKMSRQEIEVIAMGPELTFATAEVKKAARGDPWATASKTRPAPAASTFDDEPPF
jgi:single-strand DNA-binding protein